MSDHIPSAEPVSPRSSLPVQLPPARIRTRPQPASQASASIATTNEAHPAEQRDNEVGYCRPPKRTQFKPGQSGNPRGRPKGAKGLNTIVRENLTQKVGVRTTTGEKRMPRIEALVHKALEQAMKGNPRVLFELLKLYAHAVPEEKLAAQEEVKRDEDLSAADRAILAAFTQQISRERGADQ